MESANEETSEMRYLFGPRTNHGHFNHLLFANLGPRLSGESETPRARYMPGTDFWHHLQKMLAK